MLIEKWNLSPIYSYSIVILQKKSVSKKVQRKSNDDDDDDEDESSSETDDESSDEESSSDSDVKPALKDRKKHPSAPRKTTENPKKSSNIDLLLELENCEFVSNSSKTSLIILS